METGMQNLGSGGEAQASPADIDDTETDAPWQSTVEDADQSGRGGTMDAALGANEDPTIVLEGDGTINPPEPALGYGETAAYGETIENSPAPTEPVDGDGP